MLGLLIGAAVLGIIIVVMEKGEFPGWGKMILCVLAASIPSFVLSRLLPPELFFVPLLVGAVCAGLAISYTTGMGLKRAFIAAAIYFAFQLTLGLTLAFLLR